MVKQKLSFVCEFIYTFMSRDTFESRFNEVVDLLYKEHDLSFVSKIDGDRDSYLFEFNVNQGDVHDVNTDYPRFSSKCIDLMDMFISRGIDVITSNSVLEYDENKEKGFRFNETQTAKDLVSFLLNV